MNTEETCRCGAEMHKTNDGGYVCPVCGAVRAYIHNDPIDHPPHYNQGTIQPIDVIEDWDLPFHLANVVKYIARARHKGAEVEDLKKACWYLDRYLERKEK